MLLNTSLQTIASVLILLDSCIWKGLRIMEFTRKESTILSIIALIAGTLVGTAMRYGNHL